jgi:hypothetical protein
MEHYEKYEEHEEHKHYDHHERKHKKKEILIERFEEELEDACEYHELAEEYPECAHLFRRIGREEITHAYHLREKLLGMGHEFSEEHEEKWHKVLRKYGWEK